MLRFLRFAAPLCALVLLVPRAEAQFVPLADSVGFLALGETQRAAFDQQRLGVNLQNRSLVLWRDADEAALDATNWEAMLGLRAISEAEAYRLAGMPDEAERVRQRNQRAGRGQLLGGVVFGLGTAALLYGLSPVFFDDPVPVAGTESDDPNVPPIFESPSVRPLWIALGSAAVVGGSATFIINAQRRRVRLNPLRAIAPGFGTYNSALADELAAP